MPFTFSTSPSANAGDVAVLANRARAMILPGKRRGTIRRIFGGVIRLALGV
jgi:hypothetical protein